MKGFICGVIGEVIGEVERACRCLLSNFHEGVIYWTFIAVAGNNGTISEIKYVVNCFKAALNGDILTYSATP